MNKRSLKRIVLCGSVMIWLFSSAQAAKLLDVSKLTDEQVLMAYEDIMEAIEDRGLTVPGSGLLSPADLMIGGEAQPEPTTTTYRNGKYIVGTDIVPGTYTVVCIESEGDSYADAMGSVGTMLDTLGGESQFGALYSGLGSMMGSLIEPEFVIVDKYGNDTQTMTFKTGDSREITLRRDTAVDIRNGAFTLTGPN